MSSFIGNVFDSIFMEGYMPTRNMLNINYIISKGNSSSYEKTQVLNNQILNMVPSKINFVIENNIAISTPNYVNNTLTIAELLRVRGLNSVSLNKEEHSIIAKVNLYTSSSMF